MNTKKEKPKIVIVGGGVGGVGTALELDRIGVEAEITLIDNKSHFEYHSALYRVVTGGSVMEVCVPYDDIFEDTNVKVVRDTVDNVVDSEKVVWGVSGSRYQYDSLVLAIGSQANYFGIPGLEERAFSFKTTNDALRLRRHLEETFESASTLSSEEKAAAANIVIVGAGATGTEIAGQLVHFCENLAKRNDIDPSYVTVELIEAKNRVLSHLRKDASERAEARLRDLGVNIFLNRVVEKKGIDEICMRTMQMDTKTVIWTAGVKAHQFYNEIDGIHCNERGCVEVNDDFEVSGMPHVYVIGDGANAKYSGMAQTAEHHGKYVAKVISEKILVGDVSELPLYKAKKPAYVVPVGKRWAVAQWGPFVMYGYLGWLLRRAADFRFYGSILSPKKAINAFRYGHIPCREFELEQIRKSKEEEKKD